MSDLHALNLEPGDIVGGYTLVSRLGRGAMGSVWRVVDGGGTNYAMKILRDSLDDEDTASQRAQATARERLRREAMALKRIKDPGVCSIVDMEIDDALAFIVTELIEGKNLREDVMQNGRYVGEDLERLASKLIDAVRAVHAAGIVHRDIKPTNVMISVTGPVLVDFGIAMGEGESHVTSTGLVMGTPGFIAPEIIEGTEANDATDWWSTASVLAFAATGAPVFGTQPMMAVLQREAAGNANLQGLPPRTLQAFRAALDPNPRQRCTPAQLLEAIQADAWQTPEPMPPFDSPAPMSGATLRKNQYVDNPRRLWRAQSMPTAMISYDPAELHASAPAQGEIEDPVPTVAVPAPSAQPAEAATQALPQEQPEERTQVFAPPLPPAQPLQRLQPQYDAANAAVAPATAAPAQPLPAAQPDPLAAAFVDPRPRLTARGRLACAALAVPLALCAASMPLIALIAASMLMWLLIAFGLDASAQTMRVLRRAGQTRTSDGALRVLTLPWHALKAAAFALPRMLAMWLVYALMLALATVGAGLPTTDIAVALWDWTVQVPVPYDVPQSAAGAAAAAVMAVSWLACALGPKSQQLRLGAGWAIGLTRRQNSTLTGSARANHRQFVWLAVTVACVLAAAVNLEVAPVMDWFPLPTW
ncbi:Serine/threonine protein kinase [Bifidobacterium pseudolongum subsp. globosum]|uniref:serine/threonine-protein kinase n=1 Tax=Bifidobacterium TaxID=1678 RepID=UPI000C6FE383|nr:MULTISPECIES: serine/threonine-protein kinase [Bifidobacterium]MBQ1600369.1 protein kinase [Bifidobacterium sp.]NLW57312.1 protein kinase [Bifidobacterium pseudolongum subsp. globosum]PKU93998.1 serine/threonine protein kinase [Bifidobacterium pseudolongum subsp. globosum]RYP94010.1 Serine/threonine protein kinase [Bifidobacterium pseudolongum subsp. globosum]RYP94181.1 Serine/threonine protein kinase [Bifidobacterium pseudolongum subsp. globosum]